MRGGCASTQAIVALLHTLMALHGAQHCTKILTAIQIREIIQIEIRLRTEAGVKQREHGL